MEESTTYQLILERGRVAGRAEGALKEARHLVLRAGTDRFGPPDQRTAKALEKIDDLERLEELVIRVGRVQSWPELLPPARRAKRNGRT
jgi:hypothetical protein